MSKSSEMTNAIVALLVILLLAQLYRVYKESGKENYAFWDKCNNDSDCSGCVGEHKCTGDAGLWKYCVCSEANKDKCGWC